MNKELIYDLVAKAAKIEVSEVRDELRIKEDLKLDSLDLVEIVMDVEEQYNITIDDEVATTIKTVGDIIEVLK